MQDVLTWREASPGHTDFVTVNTCNRGLYAAMFDLNRISGVPVNDSLRIWVPRVVYYTVN